MTFPVRVARVISPTIAALVASVGLAAAGPAPVLAAPAEPTEAAINPSFSPDRLGAKAAFTFKVHFTGGEFGVPSPVRKAVVHFPPGLKMYVPKIRECTRARLQARGAEGCPPRSQIGIGQALGDVHVGSLVEGEEAAVSAYLGPPLNGNPTIEILAQGYSPLDVRVVITGTVILDRPPYGEELVMSIPAIPTIPFEPNASTVTFSLTVGAKRFRKHDPNAVTLPSNCPVGGFPFGAEFTYEDGSTSSTTSKVPCP
jgi:hypothetical protein